MDQKNNVVFLSWYVRQAVKKPLSEAKRKHCYQVLDFDVRIQVLRDIDFINRQTSKRLFD